MYTELRRYKDKEFCKDRNCFYLSKQGKCTNKDGCCSTAKEFHHWLNENGFLLLKPTSNINKPVEIDGTPKRCKECGGSGLVKYYHDAGDHFGAGTSPFSEWITKPCPACAA